MNTFITYNQTYLLNDVVNIFDLLLNRILSYLVNLHKSYEEYDSY